jgi:hypothetical protein
MCDASFQKKKSERTNSKILQGENWLATVDDYRTAILGLISSGQPPLTFVGGAR